MTTRILRSLRGRIAVVVGLVYILGVLLITFVVTHILHDDMEALIANQQLSSTQHLAQDIDNKLSLRLESLQHVAGNFPGTLAKNPARLQGWLEDRSALNTLFPTGLILVPADGGPVLADTPRLANRPKSFVDRDWYIALQATGQPVFSKPLITRATQEAALVVAVPVFNSHGQILSILAGITSLNAHGFLNQIVGARPGPNGSYQLISPAHHAFIQTSEAGSAARNLPPPGKDAILDRALKGERGIFSETGPSGEHELAAVVEIPQTKWLLVARQPTNDVFAPARNSLSNTLILVTVLAFPLFALMFSVLGRLLRPLALLSGELHAMADGRRPMQPLSASTSDEVGQVVDSFNQLQEKLIDQETRLAELAHHDALTGLPNRRTINNRLNSELMRIRRNKGGLALLFLDLDGFKPVNDTYGHQIGDKLLIQVARRLQACVRDIDTVGRLGGDEFLILLSDNESPAEAAKRVAENCIGTLSVPVYIDELRITIGVSIGIAITEGAGAQNITAEQLLGHADLAMYQAKAEGRGRYILYHENLSTES